MKKLWFKNKTYGYGWTPASWEGWLTLVGYIVACAAIFMRIDESSPSGSDTLIAFAPKFIVLTVALLLVARATGEKPRWRWGK